MPGHTAVILGAGFSRPAGGPLLKDLLSEDVVAVSEAESTSLTIISELLRLHQASRDRQTLTIEDVFTEIWREARTGGRIRLGNDMWRAADLLSQLTIHLSSVCGRIHVRRSTRLWATYAAFFSNLLDESRSLTVVTFNYDLLAEQVLDDLGVRYDYGSAGMIEFDDSRRRRRLRRSGSDVSLLKMHGSANWGVCRGCRESGKHADRVTSFEKPYVPIRRKSCPWCGEKFLEPGLIPPILGKAGESRHMEPIWRLARKSLDRARELIVIGYSLPASDVEAISLFREIDSPGKRPRIKVVCGPGGAPPTYKTVFRHFTDTRQYFEDYVLELLT